MTAGGTTARFFLDTNVFVYTFDTSAPRKAKRAAELIREGVESGRGVVSYQTVQEFFNVALQKFPQPLSSAEAEEFFGTIFRPLLAVLSSNTLYLEALQIRRTYNFRWYDSLMVASALTAKCGVFYSEDLQHGQKIETLRVENPFL